MGRLNFETTGLRPLRLRIDKYQKRCNLITKQSHTDLLYINHRKRNEMKSKTVCSYPIIAALVAAAKELKPGSRWRAGSHQQMQFMAGPFTKGELDVENFPEISTKSSNDAATLNKFLVDNGFSIRLDPFEPDEFGVVSILKLLLEWLEKGRETVIRYQDTMYPAAQLTKDCVSFFSSPNHSFPVVVIKTKTGDEVLLSMADPSYEGSDLDAHIDRVFGDLKRRHDFAGLIFPMVDLDERVDISWLIGMSALFGGGIVGRITQALQQTKFAMDEKGAKVESAVALGVMRCSLQEIVPDHTINQPFFAMVRRQGLQLPIFSGYIAPDCWKKPVR